ncbi:helix-turn-helix domain-containing protein [Flavobacterium amniphilum]|uniref:helix-turn-helix domain-containing protein n=1 Tax=Flavobacterium amniphilum TaxID=1834035 RepID=UPI002029C12D|nr:helix-turn-helix domain-containing protein [Flavobacterium amniphilum]MCL9806940.1 helix-turn-helix domain-containing protein [Flavobacterium amniphilum]
MAKEILQFENINATDFKNEIIDGVILALKNNPGSLQLNEQTDQLLTRLETAKLLSISLVTLWDWTKKDIIPAYRIGNKVRYKRSEILKSLNQKNQFGEF